MRGPEQRPRPAAQGGGRAGPASQWQDSFLFPARVRENPFVLGTSGPSGARPETPSHPSVQEVATGHTASGGIPVDVALE